MASEMEGQPTSAPMPVSPQSPEAKNAGDSGLNAKIQATVHAGAQNHGTKDARRFTERWVRIIKDGREEVVRTVDEVQESHHWHRYWHLGFVAALALVVSASILLLLNRDEPKNSGQSGVGKDPGLQAPTHADATPMPPHMDAPIAQVTNQPVWIYPVVHPITETYDLGIVIFAERTIFTAQLSPVLFRQDVVAFQIPGIVRNIVTSQDVVVPDGARPSDSFSIWDFDQKAFISDQEVVTASPGAHKHLIAFRLNEMAKGGYAPQDIDSIIRHDVKFKAWFDDRDRSHSLMSGNTGPLQSNR